MVVGPLLLVVEEEDLLVVEVGCGEVVVVVGCPAVVLELAPVC